MIAALLCALFGHRPHTTRFMLGDERFHREVAFSSGWQPPVKVRPCTRCPAYVEVDPL